MKADETPQQTESRWTPCVRALQIGGDKAGHLAQCPQVMQALFPESQGLNSDSTGFQHGGLCLHPRSALKVLTPHFLFMKWGAFTLQGSFQE